MISGISLHNIQIQIKGHNPLYQQELPDPTTAYWAVLKLVSCIGQV